MPAIVERNMSRVRIEQVALAPSVFGNTFYVDPTNGVDTNTGRDPRDAKLTIAGAISAGAAGDTIVLAPGTHTVASATAALVPKANMIFMAARDPGMARPSVIITGNGGATLVDIEVAGVDFSGILFLADAAAVTQLILIADTATATSPRFYHCWFDGATFATVNGLNIIDGTFVTAGMSVFECRFTDLDVGVNVGVLGIPGATIRRNVFELRDNGGADVGIALADTTAAATGYGHVIRDNDFIGPPDAGADSVGISIAGTENTTGMGIIRGNFFSFCTAAAITIDKLSKSEINNYVGDAATGGTLVDPGT